MRKYAISCLVWMGVSVWLRFSISRRSARRENTLAASWVTRASVRLGRRASVVEEGAEDLEWRQWALGCETAEIAVVATQDGGKVTRPLAGHSVTRYGYMTCGS